MFVTWIGNKWNAWVKLEISKSGHNWTLEKYWKNHTETWTEILILVKIEHVTRRIKKRK